LKGVVEFIYILTEMVHIWQQCGCLDSFSFGWVLVNVYAFGIEQYMHSRKNSPRCCLD